MGKLLSIYESTPGENMDLRTSFRTSMYEGMLKEQESLTELIHVRKRVKLALFFKKSFCKLKAAGLSVLHL